MRQVEVGVIGGTGLGEALIEKAGGEQVLVETPFGPPSSTPVVATWEGVDFAFLARHGEGHRFNPSTVPYRANIWALKKLGVRAIVASGATGSLREEIQPGHLVLCDQVIDKTFRRASTFFDEGIVAHVEFADPFCDRLRRLLVEAGKRVEATVHDRGTYICMEGPQFSTRAESHMHRSWGGDLVGMTCMPEAKLAREAELCYALIALPTDYDCWRAAKRRNAVVGRALPDAGLTGEARPTPAPDRGSSGEARPTPEREDELLQEILGNLRRATEGAMALLGEALKLMAGGKSKCRCHDALKLAIWSDVSRIEPAVRRRLAPLIGRYSSDAEATTNE